jgi:hypothetical protein
MYRFLFLFLLTLVDFADATPPLQKRFLLITGCGRSGTAYIQEFLSASGMGITHEKTMGDHGCVSWLMAADCDWAPWGPLSRKYAFDHIFHQVRAPIKVIQSLYNFPPLATWKWIATIIPEIQLSDPPLTKAAKYWYYWNLMAESKAEWTYRIEDIDTAYEEMSRRLGVPLTAKVLKTIPKNKNTRGEPNRVITWKILHNELDRDLFHKVRDLAIRYGYNPPEFP